MRATVRRPGPGLRVRLVASSALLSLLVVVVAVTTLIAVLRTETQHQVDARLADRSAALAATIAVAPGGAIDVVGSDDALFDGPDWVFDVQGRQVEGQRLPALLRAPVHRAAQAVRRTAVQRQAGDWHLRAVPVLRDGRLVAVGVTAVDAEPYRATLASVAAGAAVVAVLAVLGSAALAALVLARGLGPIAAMTEQAAAWSRTESHRRFGLGPPRDELTGLAAVLDELLDRVDEALESERRLTAEVAHELRTPLTALQAEAELGLLVSGNPQQDAERFARMRDAALTMAGAMTVLLDAERPGRHAPPGPVLPAVRAALDAAVGERHVQGVVTGDPAARTPLTPATLDRVLGPVLANAAAAARSRIEVHFAVDAGRVVVEVADDGSGVDPAIAADLFRAGVTATPHGTGLGLGIARRLARGAGGDVVLIDAATAHFRITLPADHVE